MIQKLCQYGFASAPPTCRHPTLITNSLKGLFYNTNSNTCQNIRRDPHRLAETCKYPQRPAETRRDLQIPAETCKYPQRPADTRRDLRNPAETRRITQKPAETCRNPQKTAETCRNLQQPAESSRDSKRHLQRFLEDTVITLKYIWLS